MVETSKEVHEEEMMRRGIEYFKKAGESILHIRGTGTDPWAEACFNIGMACLSITLCDVAFDAFKKSISYDPLHTEKILDLIKYYGSGWEENAIEVCEEILRKDPTNLRARELLQAYQTRLSSEELDRLSEALKACPNDPGLHYSLGSAYLKLGQTDRAMDEHSKLKLVDQGLAQALLSEITETVIITKTQNKPSRRATTSQEVSKC